MLRLCEAFHEADAASHAPDDAGWETHLDRCNEIADAIKPMTATSEAGKQAKAGVALRLLLEQHPEPSSDMECMVASALRDIVGVAA